jgi:transposase-like protein
MLKKTRKQYTPEFKFKLVTEALKNDNMTTIARQHGINFALLAKWKAMFLQNGQQVFEMTDDKEKEELKKTIARLERIVGRKEIELNLLKNFSDFYESQSMP